MLCNSAYSMGYSTGTVKNAIKFMDSYYQDVRQGVTFNAYSEYYTNSYSMDIERQIKVMSRTMNTDIESSKSHWLDYERMSLQCEERMLTKAKTWGYGFTRAVLEYAVSDACSEHQDVSLRTIELLYSAKSDNWQIERIHEGNKH